MSLTISVEVADGAVPAIQAKMAKCLPRRLAAIVGPACTRQVQTHLIANGENKKGWPSTHFYAAAAMGTSWEAVGGLGSVLISINKIGIRQRYYGGMIAPVNAKALAIPISPVSYGHLPSDFPNLFLLKTKLGAYLVQYGQTVSGLNASGGGRAGKLKGATKLGGNAGTRIRATLNFLFKLVGSVEQQGDPTVIPSAAELLQVARGRIMEAIK